MKRVLITGGLGYIGSALAKHLQERNDLRVVILDRKMMAADYAGMVWYEPFDVIVHLAAHSSVRACQDDPRGAWANNVTGFAGLLQRLRPDQRLIYASSGSVYDGSSVIGKEDQWLAPPTALYDLTKATMDHLAGLSNLDYYGLRFGTVCGASPNMRWELMINAMAKAALQAGYIDVANPNARRSILAMDDLCKTVEAIIDCPDSKPGIYNVASLNGTVGGISLEVAAIYGAGRCFLPMTPCYDFTMSNQKAVDAFGYWPKATVASIVRSLHEGGAL